MLSFAAKLHQSVVSTSSVSPPFAPSPTQDFSPQLRKSSLVSDLQGTNANGKFSVVVLSNQSAALNTVDHSKLLEVLSSLGLRATALLVPPLCYWLNILVSLPGFVSFSHHLPIFLK